MLVLLDMQGGGWEADQPDQAAAGEPAWGPGPQVLKALPQATFADSTSISLGPTCRTHSPRAPSGHPPSLVPVYPPLGARFPRAQELLCHVGLPFLQARAREPGLWLKGNRFVIGAGWQPVRAGEALVPGGT